MLWAFFHAQLLTTPLQVPTSLSYCQACWLSVFTGAGAGVLEDCCSLELAWWRGWLGLSAHCGLTDADRMQFGLDLRSMFIVMVWDVSFAVSLPCGSPPQVSQFPCTLVQTCGGTGFQGLISAC